MMKKRCLTLKRPLNKRRKLDGLIVRSRDWQMDMRQNVRQMTEGHHGWCWYVRDVNGNIWYQGIIYIIYDGGSDRVGMSRNKIRIGKRVHRLWKNRWTTTGLSWWYSPQESSVYWVWFFLIYFDKKHIDVSRLFYLVCYQGWMRVYDIWWMGVYDIFW